MKKMFLTSSFKDSFHYLEAFAKEELRGKTVTFIDTASLVEEMTHYVDSAIDAFNQLGMLIERLDISRQNRESIEKTIKKNQYIYVSGGNTFYLLQELKNKAVDTILLSEINKGKIYIGESAGSVIMSPNIAYIALADNSDKAANLSDYTGLNQLTGYPVPHLNSAFLGKEMNEIIKCYQDKLELIPITDEQVVLFENDTITII